ncbi:MAG: extracellular matrix regulator RemB [Bacillota bacterium]
MLHLGQDYTIPAKDVVLIADWEATIDSKDTVDFLDISEEEGFIIDYANGDPKSFVVTEEKIYYSIISSSTLKKRMNFVYNLE